MDMLDDNFRIGSIEGMRGLGSPAQVEKEQSDISFKDLLKGLVDQVDSLQKDADASIEGLATGETTDVHDVTIKMQEAGVAFDLMMEVRNKLLDAYNKIIKMQS